MKHALCFCLAVFVCLKECAPKPTSIAAESSGKDVPSYISQESKELENKSEHTNPSTRSEGDTPSEISTRGFRGRGRSRFNAPWMSRKFGMFSPPFFYNNFDSMFEDAFYGNPRYENGYGGQYPGMFDQYGGMYDSFGTDRYDNNYGSPYNYPQGDQGRYPAYSNQQQPSQSLYDYRPTEMKAPSESSYYGGQPIELNRLPQQQMTQSSPPNYRNQALESSRQQQQFGTALNRNEQAQLNGPSRRFNPSSVSPYQSQTEDLNRRTQTAADPKSSSSRFNPSSVSPYQNQFEDSNRRTQTAADPKPSFTRFNPSSVSPHQNQIEDLNRRTQTATDPTSQNYSDQRTNVNEELERAASSAISNSFGSRRRNPSSQQQSTPNSVSPFSQNSRPSSNSRLQTVTSDPGSAYQLTGSDVQIPSASSDEKNRQTIDSKSQSQATAALSTSSGEGSDDTILGIF